MEDLITASIPSIISGVMILAVGSVAGFLWSQLKGFKSEHTDLLDIAKQFKVLLEEHQIVLKSMRDIIRNSIVRICEECIDKGSISENQIKSLCELHDSYKLLEGNGYVDELFYRAMQVPIEGTNLVGKGHMDGYNIVEAQ